MISNSVEETKQAAKKIAEKIKNGGVVCLFGDLGSGKTVFVKGLADSLGIKEFSIKSPTFTYIREHGNFYHIDLYRLESPDEILLQTIKEIMGNRKNIVVIEWADKLGENLPKNAIKVYMQYINENSRKITL